MYRIKGDILVDISYEFFQFFRFSDLQDNWVIEIIRLMDGDRTYIKGFNELRLYNFARLITQINLFVRSGNIYKYKFPEYIKRYYNQAVNHNEVDRVENAKTVKVVEIYTYRQLLNFMFANLAVCEALFHSFPVNWVVELVNEYGRVYNDLLTKDELISVLLKNVSSAE